MDKLSTDAVRIPRWIRDVGRSSPQVGCEAKFASDATHILRLLSERAPKRPPGAPFLEIYFHQCLCGSNAIFA